MYLKFFSSIFAAALLLMPSTHLIAQEAETPALLSHGSMSYPPIGRAAHVEGDVTITFNIDSQGQPSEVTYKSGPKMLSGVAIDAVKQWRFSPPTTEAPSDNEYSAVFHFRLAPPEDGYNESGESKTLVEVHSASEVEVIGIAASGLNRDKCPSSEEREPPKDTTPNDYVELSRTGCYGSCPSYKVRLYRDGRTKWDGDGFVSTKGHAEVHIPATDAEALLLRFQNGSFWSLCGSYSKNVTDSASTQISTSIGGRSKTIAVYADSAPDIYFDLEMEIDRAANTHQWRHGNPSNEPLANIDTDSFSPKPGVTALMIAATTQKTAEMQHLIDDGADPNAVDASGWSPLMYAAASYQSPSMSFLLKAGASPNYQSPQGDTALMASAMRGFLDQDLIAAGANINLQNKKGVNVLMLLADRGEADEIASALKAGANTSLKDAKGRTALDYLRLANCGKSAVPREEWMTTTYSKCTALDKDGFSRSEALLKRAMASKTGSPK